MTTLRHKKAYVVSGSRACLCLVAGYMTFFPADALSDDGSGHAQDMYTQVGMEFLNKGWHEEAAPAFRSALNQNPRNVQALYLLALTLAYHFQDIESRIEAGELLEEAMGLGCRSNPPGTESFGDGVSIELGVVKYYLQDYKGAQRLLQREESERAILYLALAELRLGRLDDARNRLASIRTDSPFFEAANSIEELLSDAIVPKGPGSRALVVTLSHDTNIKHLSDEAQQVKDQAVTLLGTQSISLGKLYSLRATLFHRHMREARDWDLSGMIIRGSLDWRLGRYRYRILLDGAGFFLAFDPFYSYQRITLAGQRDFGLLQTGVDLLASTRLFARDFEFLNGWERGLNLWSRLPVGSRLVFKGASAVYWREAQVENHSRLQYIIQFSADLKLPHELGSGLRVAYLPSRYGGDRAEDMALVSDLRKDQEYRISVLVERRVTEAIQMNFELLRSRQHSTIDVYDYGRMEARLGFIAIF